ncbi:acyltransferase domain-containing protein [Nocardia sp. NPDC005825]|uniref:ACP S-malonyltransferase n=1 Tax=unclassified Nocardia TaxID=2637762 RepID=UPI0033D416B2
MSVAFLYPGQGTEQVGMLHRLPESAGDVLDTAAAVLGVDPHTLDSRQAMVTGRARQLSLLISGVAWTRELRRQGVTPAFVAGHSVGIWPAAVAAGAVEFGDALALVGIRATEMDRTVAPDLGALVIDGAAARTVERVVRAHRDRGARVWVSIVNSPCQVVVAGERGAIDTVVAELTDPGYSRVTPLAPGLAVHTPILGEAASRLRHALGSIRIREPEVPIAGLRSGRPLPTADALRTELWSTVAEPVRWWSAVSTLAVRGVAAWIQLPPGRTLLNLLPDHRVACAVDEIGVVESAARVRRETTSDPGRQ